MFRKFLFMSTLALTLSAAKSMAVTSEEMMGPGWGDSLGGYGVSFFSIASTTSTQLDSQDASIGSYNYFGLNWRLGSDTKASLRLPFTYDSQGQNKYGDQINSEVALSDIHAAYSMYDLGYIGDIDISGVAKIYFPTSEASQEMNTIAKFRFEVFGEYYFNRRWSLEYRIKPDLYWQTQKAYFNTTIPQFEDGNFVTDPRQTTKIASLEHILQLEYYVNRYLSFTTAGGFDEDWYNASATEDLPGGHVTYSSLSIGFSVRPLSKLSFLVQMTNKFRLESYRGQDIGPFRPENLQYSVMTNAAIF